MIAVNIECDSADLVIGRNWTYAMGVFLLFKSPEHVGLCRHGCAASCL
jgi:hypothetical protein